MLFRSFLTEELWHSMGERPYDLIVAKWPEPEASPDADAMREINWLKSMITEARATRAALNVPPGPVIQVSAWDVSEAAKQWTANSTSTLRRMARIDGFFNILSAERASNSAQFVVDGATYIMPLEGVIDLDAERARLCKAVAAAEKDRDGLAARLANPAFAERAKPEAVAKAREDHDLRAAEADRLSAALARLG